MFKLIIIIVIALYVIRLIYRGIQQATPKSVAPIELKACAYCGVLVRVDQGIVADERFFCSAEHLKLFHNR
jgi:hypothetical protein